VAAGLRVGGQSNVLSSTEVQVNWQEFHNSSVTTGIYPPPIERWDANRAFGSGFDRPFGENRVFGDGFAFGVHESGQQRR